ncbi:MAG: hypothetical protein RBS43_09485 [Candidatus Cloacimonas sp.]|jgi:hypothetical protein|nr:hypothetical protein [Candidatus Cloacimonas sp.]
MRESNSPQALRLYGIDAANTELGVRPEEFAKPLECYEDMFC